MARVRILSRKEAILHSQFKEIPSCVIVSITHGSGCSPSFYLGEDSQVKDVFPLFFDDIDREYKGYKACQESDFRGLKDFIDKWKDKVEEIIVHCHAGISRSSGCAAAICQYLQLDDDFIWDGYSYIPNSRVYRMTKTELGLLISEEKIKELFSRNYDAQMRLTLFSDISQTTETD